MAPCSDVLFSKHFGTYGLLKVCTWKHFLGKQFWRFYSCFSLQWGPTLKGKNLLHREQILPCKSTLVDSFGKIIAFQERKPENTKCLPLCNRGRETKTCTHILWEWPCGRRNTEKRGSHMYKHIAHVWGAWYPSSQFSGTPRLSHLGSRLKVNVVLILFLFRQLITIAKGGKTCKIDTLENVHTHLKSFFELIHSSNNMSSSLFSYLQNLTIVSADCIGS